MPRNSKLLEQVSAFLKSISMSLMRRGRSQIQVAAVACNAT